MTSAPHLPRFERNAVVSADDRFRETGRTLMVLSDEYANALFRRAACVQLMSIKNDPHKRKRVPGWVRVDESTGNLRRDSFITFYIKQQHGLRGPHGSLNGQPAEEARDHLWTCLSDLERHDPRSNSTFLRLLPPPSLRHNRDRLVVEAFDVLRRLRWSPPMRGDILKLPEWNHLAADYPYWVVVSNNEVNLRFRRPVIIYVPLQSLAGSPYPRSQWERHGRVVVGKELGLPGDFYARADAVCSFDYSSDWFDECNRCYQPDTTPPRTFCWFVPPNGPEGMAGRCLQCDRPALSSLCFPGRVAELPEPRLTQLANLVRHYLGVE